MFGGRGIRLIFRENLEITNYQWIYIIFFYNHLIFMYLKPKLMRITYSSGGILYHDLVACIKKIYKDETIRPWSLGLKSTVRGG